MEEEKTTLYRPTQAERLGRFAVSHFVISVLGALLAMSVGFVILTLVSQSETAMYIVLIVCSVAGMAAYAAAGFHSAETYRWSRPKNFGNGFLIFLFPALIAWAWGSLMLCCASLSGRAATDLLSGLLTVNFFAALPSFVMVVTSLLLGFLDGGLPNMIICMLFVGGLPPLMFLLGSVWAEGKTNNGWCSPQKERRNPMKQNEGMQLRDPSQGERFKWFAISHFSISIIGVMGAFLSTALDGAMVAVLLLWEVVLLALYAAAGVWIARKRNWCKPQSVREGIRAFLSPTLVAWLWGGIFLVFLSVPGLMSGMGDAGDMLAIGLMYSLLFLAFPSSGAFIILVLLVGGLEADFTAEWLLYFVYMLIVGAVPPGLFLLGSVLGGRKEQTMNPQE